MNKKKENQSLFQIVEWPDSNIWNLSACNRKRDQIK
jgi:hypothetical protein